MNVTLYVMNHRCVQTADDGLLHAKIFLKPFTPVSFHALFFMIHRHLSINTTVSAEKSGNIKIDPASAYDFYLYDPLRR